MKRFRKHFNVVSAFALVLTTLSATSLANCTMWIFHEPAMPKSR